MTPEYTYVEPLVTITPAWLDCGYHFQRGSSSIFVFFHKDMSPLYKARVIHGCSSAFLPGSLQTQTWNFAWPFEPHMI